LIRSTGFNGFPRGIDDNISARQERPAKYRWTEHAERNAIFNAARIGISTEGCTCYVNWFPCIECARGIIQAGIFRLVGLEPDRSDPKWGDEFDFAFNLFREAGVELSLYDVPALVARK
jgi:dCMP deaminase